MVQMSTDDDTTRPVDIYQSQSGNCLPTHEPTVRPRHTIGASRSGQTEHMVRNDNSFTCREVLETNVLNLYHCVDILRVPGLAYSVTLLTYHVETFNWQGYFEYSSFCLT